MSRVRRSAVKVGDSLAIDFANTMPSSEEAGALRSWGDLVDFLELRGRGTDIRRCANPRCHLYFRDPSRTRRRRWCSMAVCGNRMKVAAHLRRHGRRGPR